MGFWLNTFALFLFRNNEIAVVCNKYPVYVHQRSSIVIILHCAHEKLIKLKAKTQMHKTCDLHSRLDIFSSGWLFGFNSKSGSSNLGLAIGASRYIN